MWHWPLFFIRDGGSFYYEWGFGTTLFWVLSFCLLGGLWGMITHVWAVYLGIVDKPPMLQGAGRVATVRIAAFEFTFYWCVILSIAVVLQQGWQWLGGDMRTRV